jgi:uroporphyrinogen-III synthase
LVFLSKNGIQAFYDNIVIKYGVNISKLSTEVWTVGARTAELTENLLKHKVKIPKNQNSIGLIESFRKLNKKDVLLITGKEPRHEFISWLSKNKWGYQQIELYRREIISNKQLAKTFKNDENSRVIFTAPSTVKGFLKSIGVKNLKKMRCGFISFGPSTTNEIESYGG